MNKTHTHIAIDKHDHLANIFSYIDASPDNQYAYAQQVRTLSLPSEMGERFKCIALTKNYEKSLRGFSQFDQRFRL